MKLDRSALLQELRALARDLGPGWSFDLGVADAYGLEAMNFAQLRNRSREISVRVWFSGSELRVGAFLGVPFEASDEVWFKSAADLIAFVRNLCVGAYDRHDGRVWVKMGRGRFSLTEWSDEVVDPSDPWRDGV